MLAAAPDAHEQAAPAGHLDQAADAQHVPERILEQDELHPLGGELLVVLVEEHERAIADHLERPAVLVHLGGLLDEYLVLVVHVVAQEADHVLRRAACLLVEGRAEDVAADLADEAVVALLVLDRRELVAEDAVALVTPQAEEHALGREVLELALRRAQAARQDRLLRREEDALEHPAQVSHVEHVVELGRGGEHPRLHHPPKLDGGVRQFADDVERVPVEVPSREAPVEHLTVDVVDARDAGQDQVEDEEVALEPVGDVVLPAARVLHGGEVLQVLARLEVPALVLVEEVEPPVLHGEADEFQRGLVAPLVHLRHRHVVEEYRHLLAVRRAEVLPAPLVELGLDGVLGHPGRGGRGEVDPLRQHGGGVLLGQEHELRSGSRTRGSGERPENDGIECAKTRRKGRKTKSTSPGCSSSPSPRRRPRGRVPSGGGRS